MLKISFEFDELSQKITNLQVTNTSKNNTSYDLEVDDNKINLTSDAVSKLCAVAGDRISINYWTVDNTTTYPIISKADVFTDGNDGSKLTKKGTFSFKGQQRTSLLKFGDKFTFTEFLDKNGELKEGVFVLTPVIKETFDDGFESETEASKELDGNKVEDEIDRILEENNYNDDLPF